MQLADILHAVSVAPDKVALQAVLNDCAIRYGMDGAYVILHNAGLGFRHLDGRPQEWLDHYAREAYVYIDPIVRRVLVGTSSFTWDGVAADANFSSRQRKMFSEARDFRLDNGYNCIQRTLDGFMSTCCFYNSHAKDFSSSMRENRGQFELIAAAVQERFISLERPDVHVPQLAPREIECLTWAALGKTNSEIGTILGLSSNTVNSYLNSAAGKLGASTKIHAVVRAMQLKIIFPL